MQHIWKKTACRVLVKNPARKKPPGRPRNICEDNIKMDLREVGWKVWPALVWLRVETNGGLM
jgi:hypothetical protein